MDKDQSHMAPNTTEQAVGMVRVFESVNDVAEVPFSAKFSHQRFVLPQFARAGSQRIRSQGSTPGDLVSLRS